MMGFGSGTVEVSFAQESFSDRLLRRERQLRLANASYIGFACVGLIAAVVSSLLAAVDMGGGSLLYLGAVVLGLLPGVAPLVLGRLIEAVSVLPEVPKHLRTDDIDEVEAEDQQNRRRLILGFGVAYFGLALLSLSFTVMLAERVGLDTPIFGVLPPGYVIPIAIEGMQVVSLFAGVRLGWDLETLRSQAAQVREPELKHQLTQQELTVRLESQRLEAETKLIEAGMENRARRVGLAERLKLQRKTVKVEAAEAARADAELAKMRRDAGFRIAKFETQAEVDIAMRLSQLKIASNEAKADQMLAALERGESIEPNELVVAGKALTRSPDLNGVSLNGNGNGTADELYHLDVR